MKPFSVMNLAIYANGDLENDELKAAEKYNFLIATDLAAIKLLQLGITPDIAVGDFDSVSKKDFSSLKKSISKIKIFSKEKNFTDLELAVKEAISFKPKRIDIFGVIGSRLDHSLASVFLLYFILKNGIHARIINSNNEIYLVNKSTVLKKTEKYHFFSLIPLSRHAVVSINGGLYDLSMKKINMGQTIGISNVLVEKKCLISVHKGIVILIRSND